MACLKSSDIGCINLEAFGMVKKNAQKIAMTTQLQSDRALLSFVAVSNDS
jgi:hypothetical protein